MGKIWNILSDSKVRWMVSRKMLVFMLKSVSNPKMKQGIISKVDSNNH